MLRFMFGEPERKAEGRLGEAIRLMEQFISLLQDRVEAGKDNDHKLRTYEIWTLGLLASLNELEQSCYAAVHFKQQITAHSVSEMSAEEQLVYKRYVYFDKNAFIRVFAILDKLSILLNDLLGMKTEKIKPHFSYFTVLRNMRESNAHPRLTWMLNDVKEQKQDAINRLRKRRNTEIHYMNTEMQDDLAQSHKMYGETVQLENIELQLADLTQSLEMVTESLLLTFQYANEWMRTK